MSNTNTSAQQLGVFGWNFSFIGDIKIVTDTNGNATILNSELQSILPAQLPGTALYDTSNYGLPLAQLISSPYRLNSQQLLGQYSDSKRMFKKQADGIYQGETVL